MKNRFKFKIVGTRCGNHCEFKEFYEPTKEEAKKVFDEFFDKIMKICASVGLTNLELVMVEEKFTTIGLKKIEN